jgi:hypothetical protein
MPRDSLVHNDQFSGTSLSKQRIQKADKSVRLTSKKPFSNNGPIGPVRKLEKPMGAWPRQPV